MTTPTIGIVADDLTGAADTGVAFCAAGRAVIVGWLDAAGPSSLWRDAEVISLTTGSRALDVEQAVRAVDAAVGACRAAGVKRLYKKVDSLLRGHIGRETRAALGAWGHGSMAIAAPAFPATGRTTVDGRQCVGGAPLPHTASWPDVFTGVGLTTRHARLADVRSEAFPAFIAAARHDRIEVIACDAVTDHDLRAIASAGLRVPQMPIWVGSGGLAHALASDDERPAPAVSLRGARTPLLVVVGSTSPIARAQARAVAADGAAAVEIRASELEAGSPEGVDLIEARLRGGGDVVVTLSEAHGASGSDDASLMTRLGTVLAPCASLTGTAILTGGDTATGMLRAWGMAGLRLGGELEPGVVLATALGPQAMAVVTKSGSFGDAQTLVRIRRQIHAETP